jgi:hypothetical protein
MESQAEPHARAALHGGAVPGYTPAPRPGPGRACGGAAPTAAWRGAQVDVYNNMGDLWRAQGTVGRNEAQRCYGQALQVRGPACAAAAALALEDRQHYRAVSARAMQESHR